MKYLFIVVIELIYRRENEIRHPIVN